MSTRQCTARLNAARRAAEKAGEPTVTDNATYIVWRGDYAEVHSYFNDGGRDTLLWKGNAHCSRCARTEAIKAQAPQGVLL
jgi:hypothetical protein